MVLILARRPRRRRPDPVISVIMISVIADGRPLWSAQSTHPRESGATGLRGGLCSPRPSNLIRIMPAQGGAIDATHRAAAPDHRHAARPGRRSPWSPPGSRRAPTPSRCGYPRTTTDRDAYELTVAVLALCRPAGADLPGQRPAAHRAGGRRGRRPRRRRRPAGGRGAPDPRPARGPRRDRPRPGDRPGAAVADGASYLGVGPAYATTTKAGLPDADRPGRDRRGGRARCRYR